MKANDRSFIHYYHNDHLGTPQKMTDSAGVVRWAADYKPFGEAAIDQTVTTITNNLRFPGQYFDVETGLHYNYYRDYNPISGRYIESDPIGLKGGGNLFIYSTNNPISLSDATGLICVRSSGQTRAGLGALLHHWPLNRQGNQYFNLLQFNLPCDSCYKPTNIRISVEVPLQSSLSSVFYNIADFSMMNQSINCGADSKVDVSIGTRVTVLTDMFDYYAQHMQICYDCTRCH